MSDIVLSSTAAASTGRPNLDRKPPAATPLVFLLLLISGLGYAVYGLLSDVHNVGEQPLAIGAFVLLGIALLIALGFEFVKRLP